MVGDNVSHAIFPFACILLPALQTPFHVHIVSARNFPHSSAGLLRSRGHTMTGTCTGFTLWGQTVGKRAQINWFGPKWDPKGSTLPPVGPNCGVHGTVTRTIKPTVLEKGQNHLLSTWIGPQGSRRVQIAPSCVGPNVFCHFQGPNCLQLCWSKLCDAWHCDLHSRVQSVGKWSKPFTFNVD